MPKAGTAVVGYEGAATALSAADLENARLQLDPAVADSISAQIASLGAEQHGDRLQRLERSLLRLERINLEILSMLQKLVTSARKPVEENSP